MTPSSRLTLLGAASAAVLMLASHAFAQAETAPPAQSQSAPQAPAGKQERPAPTGCPYRDGKLGLIV